MGRFLVYERHEWLLSKAGENKGSKMAKLKVWKLFSGWMVMVLVFGLGVGLVPASPVKAVPGSATREVSQPVQLTANPKFDRNPTFFKANNGVWWVFFARGRGDPTAPGYNPDIDYYDICYIKSTDNGATWTEGTLPSIPDGHGMGAFSPAAFQGDGKIWVFYAANGVGIFYFTSTDNGGSWNGPEAVPNEVGYTIGNHMDAICANDGKVWVFYHGDPGSAIYTRNFDSINWSSPTLMDDVLTYTATPRALQQDDGTFRVVYIAGDPLGIYLASSADGATWSSSLIINTVDDDYDPVLVKDGAMWRLFFAPYIPASDHQWLMTSSSSDLSTWSTPVRVTAGNYGANKWWDFWPEAVTVSPELVLFYASMKDGAQRGDGEIYMFRVDWNLTNNHYEAIQPAIAAANPGDTINVMAGIYNPTSTIVINKDSLVLQGPQANVDPRPSYGSTRTAGSPAEAVIDGSTSALGMIIEVNAENVVINGLEVKSGTGDMIKQNTLHGGTAVKYCIIHDGRGDEGVQLKKCTGGVLEYNYVFEIADAGDGLNIADTSSYGAIRYNEVAGIHGENAAIYIYGAEHMEIVGNLVRDSGIGGNDGIKVGDKSGADKALRDVLVKDNIIHGITQDGISVYMSGVNVEGNEIYGCGSENGAIYVAWAVSDITISNNIVHNNTLDTGKWGNPGAIMIGTGVNAATVHVNYNNIYSNTPNGVTNKATNILDATNNWWGSANGPEHSGNTFNVGSQGDEVSDNVDHVPWLNATYPGGASFAPVNNTTRGTNFSSVQAAIGAASASDIINVAAGMYAERININKAITLRGATAGVSKKGFVVPGGYAYNTAEQSVIKPSAPLEQAVVQVSSDSVVFDGFVVADEVCQTGGVYQDLFEVASSVSASNGIQVLNCVLGPNTNTAAQDGTKGRSGLCVVGPHSAGPVKFIARHNKIFDNKGNGCGIMIVGPYGPTYHGGAAYNNFFSGSVIEDNEITGNHRTGIELAGGVQGGTSPSDYVLIRNNIITNNGWFGVSDKDNLKYGHGVMFIRGASDRNNADAAGSKYIKFEGNQITDNEKSGVYMGPINSDIFFIGNTIQDNGLGTDGYSPWDGVRIDLDEAYYGAPKVTDYTKLTDINFSQNVIVGNSSGFGLNIIQVPAAGPLNAENNWWGANDGPSASPGSGDKISANVDADPWLVLNISVDPTSIIVGGAATSTITADMTKNSDDVDTSAQGHIPDGTQITFTTDKGSIGSLTVDKTTTNGIATAALTSSNTVEAATVTASAPPHTAAVTAKTTVEFVQSEPEQTGTATGTGTVTAAPSVGTVEAFTSIAEDTLPAAGKPAGVVFPHGLFSFNITGIAPGSTVTITITLPCPTPEGTQYWKCQGGVWVDCTSLLGDDDGDEVLTLTLTDGGLGDADGLANGTIVDPGGPGMGFGGGGFGGGGGVGGGIGGGGEAPGTVAAYPAVLTANIQGNITTAIMTNRGVLGETIIATDAAGKHRLEISKGSRVLLAGNKVPLLLIFREASITPPAPGNAVIVGPVYELNAYSSTFTTTPSPITISPPARLILTYDPDKLSKNVSEVFIANYDAERGWLAMAPVSGVVAEVGRAQCQVSHFSIFAVLAKTTAPAPAKFNVGKLIISPSQAKLNQEVNISVNVANTGGTSGSYILNLKVNGVSRSTKQVTVAAGKSQTVNFTVTEAQPGTYTVDIAGQGGSFVVLGAGANMNAGLIAVVIAAVLILATVVVLLLTFRRRAA